MKQNPLVSCVIIFFNAELFLEQAINSILAQTYEHWELLLVDDGSTDKSTQIAGQYAQKYPGKIQYLEHEEHKNKGMSASRNLGISYAKGKYISLLDADDIWLPQKLEEQVEILENNSEVGMVYGRTKYWRSWEYDSNSHASQDDYIPDLKVPYNVIIEPPTLLPRFFTGSAVSPCPSDVLLRKDLVDFVGGFEEDFTGIYQHCEDQAFFAKVTLCSKVLASDKCWDYYRQHSNSCSAAAVDPERINKVWGHYLNWLESYLLQKSCTDKEILESLHHELSLYHNPFHRFYNSLKAKVSGLLWLFRYKKILDSKANLNTFFK